MNHWNCHLTAIAITTLLVLKVMYFININSADTLLIWKNKLHFYETFAHGL